MSLPTTHPRTMFREATRSAPAFSSRATVMDDPARAGERGAETGAGQLRMHLAAYCVSSIFLPSRFAPAWIR